MNRIFLALSLVTFCASAMEYDNSRITWASVRFGDSSMISVGKSSEGRFKVLRQWTDQYHIQGELVEVGRSQEWDTSNMPAEEWFRYSDIVTRLMKQIAKFETEKETTELFKELPFAGQ